MFLQFSCSPPELCVEDEGGGDQEDHQDCHHHQQGSPGRVGDWEALAGVHSVILVASHTLLLKLRPTPALAECLVPHLQEISLHCHLIATEGETDLVILDQALSSGLRVQALTLAGGRVEPLQHQLSPEVTAPPLST